MPWPNPAGCRSWGSLTQKTRSAGSWTASAASGTSIEWSMRRLRALALLDPEVGAVILGRDHRRREGLAVLVGRLTGPGGGERSRAVPMLLAITSIEMFDQRAAIDQPFAEGLGEVVHLCMAAL